MDEGHQWVAETIKQKKDKEVYKSVTTAAIDEYIGLRVERRSVIEKGDTMIMLMDETRINVPQTMRRKLMEREHLTHSRINKMSAGIRAKYFWPGIEADVKRMVEACEPCQLYNRAQSREPHRPALEHVSRPMQAIGINFFKRHGSKYGSTDTAHTVSKLKRWLPLLV